MWFPVVNFREAGNQAMVEGMHVVEAPGEQPSSAQRTTAASGQGTACRSANGKPIYGVIGPCDVTRVMRLSSHFSSQTRALADLPELACPAGTQVVGVGVLAASDGVIEWTVARTGGDPVLVGVTRDRPARQALSVYRGITIRTPDVRLYRDGRRIRHPNQRLPSSLDGDVTLRLELGDGSRPGKLLVRTNGEFVIVSDDLELGLWRPIVIGAHRRSTATEVRIQDATYRANAGISMGPGAGTRRGPIRRPVASRRARGE